MPAIAIIEAAAAAIQAGSQLIPVIEALTAVSDRMKAENRADPTATDLDAFRERIAARQARIDAA